MALREYRPVGLADEKQHLGEMVVIIIDRKDWLHPYWHFQSLFAAAWTWLAKVETSPRRFRRHERARMSRSDSGLSEFDSQSSAFYFCSHLQIVKRMNQGILIGGVSRSIGATTFTDWLSR
jgi:hypothetical protein